MGYMEQDTHQEVNYDSAKVADQSVEFGGIKTADTQRKSTGLIAGMIVCAILAAGGVGFGLWGVIKSNDELSKPVVQITKDDGTVVTIEPDKVVMSDDTKTIMIDDFESSNVIKKNPIITAIPPKVYNFGFSSPKFSSDMNDPYEYDVRLGVQDGKISSCSLYRVSRVWVDDDTANGFVENSEFGRDCSMEGPSGRFYKIVLAGAGHDARWANIAFIMEDGTVEYIPMEAIRNGDFTVKGKLAIDGFVVDAIEVGVGEEGVSGGYRATIFVLSDGSYIEFSEAMLE